MDGSIFTRRKSGRSYLDMSIEQDVLERLFERIRWSPSCSNNQPWRMIFAVDKARRDALASALARGNGWAAKAPVLVAVCARKADDYTREDDPVEYHQFDCGLATMTLLLAAVEEGLMGHPMAGYSAPAVKKALDIPEEFHVLCVVSLGYEGPLSDLDEATRIKDEAPRTRKNVNDIIAIDRFSFQ